jgi:maleylacetate reductase
MHHKICHILGGRWNLPHAETHAVMLPHVLAFNAPAIPDAANRIAHALSAESALAGLTKLGAMLGAPTALSDLGLAKEDLTEAVQLILPVIPESNPRPVTEENLTILLAKAHAGR